jgi:tetratricopeptide (TPR) repeat protein
LHEEAATLYQRSLQLNPMHGSSYLAIGTFIFFELGDFQKAESLTVHSNASHWADAEVYNVANYYYLREYDKMEAHWKLFLETYRKLTSRGKEFTTREAIEWLVKINPHRNRSNLHDFFQFISDGSYTSEQLKKSQPSSSQFENFFFKEPSGWMLSFENSAVQLPEVKGFYDIQRML